MNITKSSLACTLLAALATLSAPALATNWSDRIRISGFASANYHATDDPTSFDGPVNEGHDNKGSFGGTRVGLQIDAKVNDQFRFAAQLFSSKKEDYIMEADWAFGTLRLGDNLDLRAGKLKFPGGLVNEYISVGYATPWMHAPAVIYTELGAPNGPQMTRESYSGISLLGRQDTDDWAFEADLFTGELELAGSYVRKLRGATLRADWDDTMLFQVTGYSGVMMGVEDIADAPGMAANMEGENHRALLYGFKADWNDIVVYAEKGRVEMADLSMMKADSWYTTVGYRIGKLLPTVTYESYKQGAGSMQEDQQNTTTLGLRWDYIRNVALKFEISRIKTEKGFGLFPQNSTPDASVNMFGFGIDTVF